MPIRNSNDETQPTENQKRHHSIWMWNSHWERRKLNSIWIHTLQANGLTVLMGSFKINCILDFSRKDGVIINDNAWFSTWILHTHARKNRIISPKFTNSHGIGLMWNVKSFWYPTLFRPVCQFLLLPLSLLAALCTLEWSCRIDPFRLHCQQNEPFDWEYFALCEKRKHFCFSSFGLWGKFSRFSVCNASLFTKFASFHLDDLKFCGKLTK